jgi:hypothetical protein
VSCRTAAPALASAAVTLAFAVGLTACGEKKERVPGPSRVDVRALVTAGLAAVGSNAAPPAIVFSTEGPVLRVRVAAPPAGSALLGLLASFRRVRAEIEPFCPKPALLRCRPSLRAWASPRSHNAVESTVAALRSLAARTYDEPPLVRRRGRVTSIITANGELLAAVRTRGATVMLSFGGIDPPRGPADIAVGGRLELEVGDEALAAIRPGLAPAARLALAGVRRVVVSAPLPCTQDASCRRFDSGTAARSVVTTP